MHLPQAETIDSDWYGKALSPPASYCLQHGPEGFRLTASRQAPALSAPQSSPGEFVPELWRYDVAEIFFLEPSGRYLEINLAPNGAWWARWFGKVRQAESEQPDFQEVVTESKLGADSWEASILLPDSLFSDIGGLRFNVTFILNSPRQTFHSLAKLPGAEPDFHQPDHFLPLLPGVPS
ncbi:hypothetical protein [Roseibacillus persicicus]|uniref:Carbohydrate-binding domain-containing protein n=1 Tax=Roseibacillus persicicus TaxID=454148 RepID=A0A918WLR5_9BACT|nr:hypothetical protein [Roseibacillus persicicus]GHC54759.1 hypothetical protein GCM10007100_21570 [Roseibacillus persicicus]